MAYRIELPLTNGAIRCGLALDSDGSLALADRLVVPTNVLDASALATIAAMSAAQRFGLTAGNLEGASTYHQVLVAGIYGAARLGWLGYHSESLNPGHPGSATKKSRRQGVPASDWVEGKVETNIPVETLKAILNVENVAKGVTLIYATKQNWWSTNHHTGNFAYGGSTFIRKVLVTLLDLQSAEDVSVDMVRSMHMAGHWVSTVRVLEMAGCEGLRDYWPITESDATLDILDDFKIRSCGPPAGTARVAMPVEVFKRASGLQIMAMCPDLTSLARVILAWKAISAEDYPRYHCGATFLTRQPRLDIYEGHTSIVGRAGSIVTNFYNRTTFQRSPLFADGLSYKNSDDFDDAFDIACRQAAAQRGVRGNAVIRSLLGVIDTSGFDVAAFDQVFHALRGDDAQSPAEAYLAAIANAQEGGDDDEI